MTASRPAQVTQSEGETERDGEKGGWTEQRKAEEQKEVEEEEIQIDRKDRGVGERKRGERKDEWETRRAEKGGNGREV